MDCRWPVKFLCHHPPPSPRHSSVLPPPHPPAFTLSVQQRVYAQVRENKLKWENQAGLVPLWFQMASVFTLWDQKQLPPFHFNRIQRAFTSFCSRASMKAHGVNYTDGNTLELVTASRRLHYPDAKPRSMWNDGGQGHGYTESAPDSLLCIFI